MRFDCGCTINQKMLGSGCQVCNTEHALDCLPSPEDLAEQLANQGFSQDQAAAVAENIFQPLVSLVATLNYKIENLAKKL